MRRVTEIWRTLVCALTPHRQQQPTPPNGTEVLATTVTIMEEDSRDKLRHRSGNVRDMTEDLIRMIDSKDRKEDGPPD